MMAIVMGNLEKKPQAKVAAPVAQTPAKAATPTPVAAPAASTGLKSENIFGMMATYLN